MTPHFFTPVYHGFINQWIISDTKETPYLGKMASDQELWRDTPEKDIIVPPIRVNLDEPCPLGGAWNYYEAGQNVFVEKSTFYFHLTVLDLYAATDIYVQKEESLRFRLWTASTADIWCNHGYVDRMQSTDYKRPMAKEITLHLKKGSNRIFIRLQDIGIRDTRFLFGLQLMDDKPGLQISLPGNCEKIASLARAQTWLSSITQNEQGGLKADGPNEFDTAVEINKNSYPWPENESVFDFPRNPPAGLLITVRKEGKVLFRSLEISSNASVGEKSTQTAAERRNGFRENYAVGKLLANEHTVPLLRCLRDTPQESDKTALREILDRIHSRPDCADFFLAAVMRMYYLKGLAGDEKEQFRHVVLNFRYWMDEEGTDAMCFWSENHTLLFRGCQMLGGQIFKDEWFTRSGRTGRLQAELAAAEIIKWFDAIEAHGYAEFLSSCYMPVTIAALINLADFSEDKEIAARAKKQVDIILKQAALHCFDRAVNSPQGRVYRTGALYPSDEGLQALLSYATPHAVVCDLPWVLFLATSPYLPPEGLETIMEAETSQCYNQGEATIEVYKTRQYLLSSVQIPSRPNNGFVNGNNGYQQHLWTADLSRDCHVFVNHPGCSFDKSESRPGYWYGNGILPRLYQQKNTVLEIFNIPEGYPIHFTHAYWPAGVFEEQMIQGNWAFGKKKEVYIALWCDKPLVRHEDMLLNSELRAYGSKTAWVCFCGSTDEFACLKEFMMDCKGKKPMYEEQENRLSLENGLSISWET